MAYKDWIVSEIHSESDILQHTLTLNTKAIYYYLGLDKKMTSYCFYCVEAKAKLFPIPESFGSREPTCAELLKTSELSEEQRISQLTSLCHFYMLSCPINLDPSGCQRLAQDNCQSRFKKCSELFDFFLNNPIYYIS